MADARHAFDWERMFELAIDGQRAREYYESAPPTEEQTCTMCGKMCAVRTVNKVLEENGLELGL